MKKIDFPKFGLLEIPRNKDLIFQVYARSSACGRSDKCLYIGPFYGYDTIGPRAYAVYECPSHGKFKKRIYPIQKQS